MDGCEGIAGVMGEVRGMGEMDEWGEMRGNLVGDAFTIALPRADVHGENTTNSIFIWPFFHTGVTIANPLLSWILVRSFLYDFSADFFAVSSVIWYR